MEIDRWNAGEMACGELLLALKIRLRDFPPGRVVELTATDPGAPVDIPAWCRLTGHRLVRREPPVYWIERKEN